MKMETVKGLVKKILPNGQSASVDENLHAAMENFSCNDASDSSSDESDDSQSVDEDTQKVSASDKIAKDLITEEEKEKKRAEKRRAKKKKRKEKKRLEKEKQTKPNFAAAGDSRTPEAYVNGVKSSDEGDGIDPNSAFVKKGKKKLPEQYNTKKDTFDENQKNNDSPPLNDVISIAIKGNQLAQNGDYPAAIKCFSDAIKLDKSDFRFFGNRSYCYDRIMQFEKALADAETCIGLSPEWPKGYFRKGRALAGLKQFQDAEKAFLQVLKLDKNCEEAQKELTRVRTQVLMDMGFTYKQAENALLVHNTLQQALDSLLNGAPAESSYASADDVYMSDEEVDDDEINYTHQAIDAANTLKNTNHKNVNGHPTEEKKMDPTNPDGLTALWVGNVLPTVKEKDLEQLFGKYGNVISVRCLPDKYCAFVNFQSKEAAGCAMNALQHHEIQGQNLLIKFPDNPISKGVAHTKLTKPTQPPANKAVEKKASTAIGTPMVPKVSGPVNGDECYFWRTTGCTFADKCRYKHVEKNRGVDKKPWQRTK